MFKINYQNILKGGVGPKNGLDEGALKKFCVGAQGHVSAILKWADKDGYGFLKLPDNAKLIDQVRRFAAGQKKHQWENIIVLGIGGSALGVSAIKETLLGCFHDISHKPRLIVVDNVDPVFVTDASGHLDMKKTLFIVISKSGGTVEPIALYALA